MNFMKLLALKKIYIVDISVYLMCLRRKPVRGYSNPEEFYFYLLTIKKVGGDLEIVGYFSKEKIFCTHAEFKNLTDIVVFPHFKGEGYGKWLVDLRNKLSTVKKKKQEFLKLCFLMKAKICI